jgi:hypothetical protein
MDEDVVRICVRKSLRGGIPTYFLLGLRAAMKVPDTATLLVHDPHGWSVRLDPIPA